MSTQRLDPLAIKRDSWPGLFPEDMMDVPFEHELRNVIKDIACYQLDGALRSVARVRSVLERAVGFVESLHLAEVLASEVEIVSLPHGEPDQMEPWEEARFQGEEE